MNVRNYNYTPSVILNLADGWVQTFLSHRHTMLNSAAQPVTIPTGAISTRMNPGRTTSNRGTFVPVPAGVVRFHQIDTTGRQAMIGPQEIAQQQSNALLSNLQAAQNRFYGKS